MGGSGFAPSDRFAVPRKRLSWLAVAALVEGVSGNVDLISGLPVELCDILLQQTYGSLAGWSPTQQQLEQSCTEVMRSPLHLVRSPATAELPCRAFAGIVFSRRSALQGPLPPLDELKSSWCRAELVPAPPASGSEGPPTRPDAKSGTQEAQRRTWALRGARAKPHLALDATSADAQGARVSPALNGQIPILVVRVLFALAYAVVYKMYVVAKVPLLKPKDGDEIEFHGGLFDCFQDIHTCLAAFCCLECRVGHTWHVADVLDYTMTIVTHYIALFLNSVFCLGNCLLAHFHTQLKLNRGIAPDFWGDCFRITFCLYPCMAYRAAKHIDRESSAKFTFPFSMVVGAPVATKTR